MKNAENLFVALGVVVAIVVGAYVSLPYEMPEDSLGSVPESNCGGATTSDFCSQNKMQSGICTDVYHYPEPSAAYKNTLTLPSWTMECGEDSPNCNYEHHQSYSFDCVQVPND